MKASAALKIFGLIFIAVSGSASSALEADALNTLRKQFAYNAGLHIYRKNDSPIWCAGSLISQHWILTAAHCVHDVGKGVDAYVGAWNRSDDKEVGQKRFFIPKKNIKKYPYYQPKTHQNDIAGLKFEKGIKLTEYIQPVEIPKLIAPKPRYTGLLAYTSGWGDSNDHKQWYISEILPDNVCKIYHKSFLFLESNICVDAGALENSCPGDSGGALVTARAKKLIGIFSYGPEKCDKSVPVVFTRIASYLVWIAEELDVVGV